MRYERRPPDAGPGGPPDWRWGQAGWGHAGSGPAGWGPAGWGPRRSGPPRPVVALVLLVVQLAGSTAAARHQPDARALDAVATVLLVLGPLAWVLLGRSAEARCAVAVGAAAVYLGLGYARGPVVLSAALVLLVTVAQRRRVLAWSVGLLGLGVLVAVGALSGHPVPLARLAGYAAWLVVVLLVGEGPRYRAEQVAAARRARVAETEVEASAERLQLARDLHDTVGHSLSMIAVQAGVALHLLDEHPEQARPALTAIRAASRDALEEVRTALSVLRQEGPAPRSSAPPGLARVPELVEAARLGGLRVNVDVDADVEAGPGLPAAVDSAAYRVVQEALTNVARHADASAAAVTVRRTASELVVEVTDDGRGSTDVVERGGLLGMRERAAALGGVVQVGDRPGGGFRVVVQLPLDNGSEPT